MKGKYNLASTNNFIYTRPFVESKEKQNERKMRLYLNTDLLLKIYLHTLVTRLSLQGWTLKPGYQLVLDTLSFKISRCCRVNTSRNL